jgi:hypothetical protein
MRAIAVAVVLLALSPIEASAATMARLYCRVIQTPVRAGDVKACPIAGTHLPASRCWCYAPRSRRWLRGYVAGRPI